MKQNKRGEEKLITIYWFAILVIIAGGIVAMVSVFYSSPYDVRDLETKILSEKVSDCIYYGGEFNLALNSNGVFREEFKDNFLERCSLDISPTRELEQMQYYIEVNFFKSETTKNSAFVLAEGNKNLKSDCSIEAGKEKLSTCNENEFWAKDPRGDSYLVKVLTIVKKVEQNVD